MWRLNASLFRFPLRNMSEVLFVLSFMRKQQFQQVALRATRSYEGLLHYLSCFVHVNVQ